MNLRDLKYFVALADSRHFSKASKACFVSQPSLSIQIKKLETTLGVELLERTSRSVLLTDIGKTIAEQARELLQQAAAIQEMAKQAQDPFSGELNLGVIPPEKMQSIVTRYSSWNRDTERLVKMLS